MSRFAKPILWKNGHDHEVQIDQRALIDKILARYAGQFSVFRELLQNSDDAGGKSVEIHFQTDEYQRNSTKSGSFHSRIPDLTTITVSKWVLKNDGMVFRDEDWARLKRIADGNPDIEKIGAFGVGFYSVFSVTEKPFVLSGEKWMGFYWKGDQLVARRGDLDAPVDHRWSTIDLTLRQPATLPNVFDLVQFLTSSLTFMKVLTSVTLYLDDIQLAVISKDVGSPTSHTLPIWQLWSETKLMMITGLESNTLTINVNMLGAVYATATESTSNRNSSTNKEKDIKSLLRLSFFPSFITSLASSSLLNTFYPLPSAEAKLKYSLPLTVFSAQVRPGLTEKSSLELLRSTKKPPPSQFRYDFIYINKDAYDSSFAVRLPRNRSVFDELRTSVEEPGIGKIYIGHATSQTTGIAGHMASRFIPTAEREALDFIDPTIAAWNKELLYVGGVLSRFAYEHEMSLIKDLWPSSSETSRELALRQSLRDRSIYAMKFLSFHPTTPSYIVSDLLQKAFFTCRPEKEVFPVITTHGIKQVSETRTSGSDFVPLSMHRPLIPKEALTNTMARYLSLSLVSPVSWNDILDEVGKSALTEDELVHYLTTLFRLNKEKKFITPYMRKEFLQATTFRTAVLDRGAPNNHTVIKLESIRAYIPNGRTLWGGTEGEHFSFPPNMLPYAISSQLPPNCIRSFYTKWKPLCLFAWVEHNIENGSFTPQKAEKLLAILCQSWRSVWMSEKDQVTRLLSSVAIIPSTAGLQQPKDVYLSTLHDSLDLPIVHFSGAHKGRMTKMLIQLGVRKHADVSVVIERMYLSGQWNTVELVKYLSSIKSDLYHYEMSHVKVTPLFYKEGDDLPDRARYIALQLYEPSDVLRSLGLPIIRWEDTHRWRSWSSEAFFLRDIGVRKYPPLSTILDLASINNPSIAIRDRAFQYFVSHFNRYYKELYSVTKAYHDLSFIPSLDSAGEFSLQKPPNVFLDPECVVLGLYVVHPTYRTFASRKLKVPEKPGTYLIIEILRSRPPSDPEQATHWFEYLSSLGGFAATQEKALSELEFIPRAEDGTIRHYKPKDCYLGGPNDDTFHSQLLVFVEYSPKACIFLRLCGAKDAPTVEDIVQLLVSDPQWFLEKAGDEERFLVELRSIALQSNNLSSARVADISNSPCLRGMRTVITRTGVGDDSEEVWEHSQEFSEPKYIAVVDDVAAYVTFADVLLVAPRDSLVEKLYLKCGAFSLRKNVKRDFRISRKFKDKSYTDPLRSLVLNRLALFLHQRDRLYSVIDYSWLLIKGNLKVKGARVIKSINKLQVNGIDTTRAVEISAAALRAPRNGPLTLWVSKQVDMYELADAILSHVMHDHRPNDTLLLSSLLSANAAALRRRGYNVDRIVRKQTRRPSNYASSNSASQVKHQMVRNTGDNSLPPFPEPAAPPPEYQSYDGRASAHLNRLLGRFRQLVKRPSTSNLSNPTSSVRSPMISAIPEFVPEKLQTDKDDMEPVSDGLMMKEMSSVDQEEKSATALDKLHIHIPEPLPDYFDVPASPTPSSDTSLSSPSSEDIVDELIRGSPDDLQLPHSSRPPLFPDDLQSIDSPITEDDIDPGLTGLDLKVRQAIMACRPVDKHRKHRHDDLHIKFAMESLEKGCCGVMRFVDLETSDEIGGVATFVPIGAMHKVDFTVTYASELSDFASIIVNLQDLFEVQKGSVRMVYQLEDEFITLRWRRTILLNFKYYQIFHSEQVKNGNYSKAYVFWFLSLAHAMAHNIYREHGASHEFHFSSICGKYTSKLATLLATSQKAPNLTSDVSPLSDSEAVLDLLDLRIPRSNRPPGGGWDDDWDLYESPNGNDNVALGIAF